MSYDKSEFVQICLVARFEQPLNDLSMSCYKRWVVAMRGELLWEFAMKVSSYDRWIAMRGELLWEVSCYESWVAMSWYGLIELLWVLSCCYEGCNKMLLSVVSCYESWVITMRVVAMRGDLLLWKSLLWLVSCCYERWVVTMRRELLWELLQDVSCY